MPITESAKKALRQSLRKRHHNLLYKNQIKKIIKEIKVLVSEKKKEDALKLLPLLYKKLDKAGKENVIKKNTASRLKSRLTKSISKIT